VRPARVGADLHRAPRLGIGHAPHHHHPEDVAGRAVAREQVGEVEVEDQLAVGRDERLVAAVGIEQRERVLEAAAGAQDLRLVQVLDARAVLPPVAELAPDHLAEVVRVDDEVADPVGDQVGDPVGEDREAAHRQHRLGPLGPEIAEPRRQPGTQQHRAHRV
jgi:hypothetical protein